MVIRGKKYNNVEVYKPEVSVVTGEMKERAKKIDESLKGELNKIISDFNINGLLELKGKKGKVVRLWWELGKRLSFIEKFNLDSEEKKYLWLAIYYYAGELAPGPPNERAKKSPETSHFSYCYKLGKFPKNVAMSQDWTAWVEFFDSEVIRGDIRIIEWLGKKVKENFPGGSKQNWLRELIKAIRNRFKKIDTTYWKEDRLYKELENLYKETYSKE